MMYGVSSEWWGAGVVVCLERGADLDMAQLMPLPLTVSCFSKIQIGFTFLVLAHLGSPGKIVCVCVCVCVESLARRVGAGPAVAGYNISEANSAVHWRDCVKFGGVSVLSRWFNSIYPAPRLDLLSSKA